MACMLMSDKLTYENIDPRSRSLIMLGLAIAMLAACFDGTITTTSGPVIARVFDSFDMLPWLTVAYLLCETVMVPLAGKLSDLYGRKKLLNIGLVAFMGSSLLATFAPSMEVLIVARAVQGIGGGILIPVCTAAVSDLYAPETRGKIQGAIGAIYGIGMGAGPLIGGALCSISDLGWHISFFINVPIILVIFALCKRPFPGMMDDGKKPTIDYKGIALLSAALIMTIAFFESIGKAFDIVSIESFAMVLVIFLLFGSFFSVESVAAEPIIAPHVLRNPTVRSASLLLLILGFAMVGDELFSSMYMQRVVGFSAMEAGMFVVIMVIGMSITSSIAGATMGRTGYKPWIAAGPVLMGLGFFLLSYITPEFNAVEFAAGEFLFGAGGGCLIASLMTAVQNSCDEHEVGMTTSAVSMFRNIGSTVGSTVFTLIVNAIVYTEAVGTPAEPYRDMGIGILNVLGSVSETVGEAIKLVFTDSVGYAFGAGALALLVATVIGFRFKIVKTSHTRKTIIDEDD